MKKIIGLDLGTTSIGWALVHEKENDKETSSIESLGVRLVSLTADEKDNYEKGKAVTINADRRMKRSLRRNLQRYKLRRKALHECLVEHGIIKADRTLCETGADTTFETHHLRAMAVEEEISLEEFARVLFMINKKRGYKSSRKINSGEEGELVDGISVAKKLSDEGITPGQLLYDRIQHSGKRIKLPFYRSDLQNEFDRILDCQAKFYPDILDAEMKAALRKQEKPSTLFRTKKGILTRKNSGKNAYITELKWRSEAISKQLDIDVVAYVLDRLNTAIYDSSQYLGMISDRSKELYFNHLTIGQKQYQTLCENRHSSLRNMVFYRQDYLDEFNAIWDKQATYHPELTPELKKKIRDIIIFYQRDLKSQKGLVSYCELEHHDITVTTPEGKTKTVTTGSKVCPKSSPLFQDFKIWQRLNDIIVTYTGKSKKSKKATSQADLFGFEADMPQQRFLDPEEKELLFEELSIKAKMSKKEILTLLFDNPKELDLNFKEVDGNTTMAALFASYQEILTLVGYLCDFSKMGSKAIKETIESAFTSLGYNTGILTFNSSLPAEEMEAQPSYQLWHLLYSYTGDKSISGNEALYRKIGKLCGFERECAVIMERTHLQPDYGSLSTKAIRRILPFMMQGYEYSKACQKAGYNHSARSLTKEELLGKQYKDQLELLPKNSLRNPVVEKIINQMINVVNSISAKYGRPDEIRIELARELKKSQKERLDMDEAIKKNTRESERIRNILQTKFHFARVSKNDILRYRLYEELKPNRYYTLYSNTYIREEKLFSKDFDIEHIIPQACLFDDSFSNKTLETRKVNIAKGRKTAYDFVLGKYGEEKAAQYTARVKALADKLSRTKISHLLMKQSEIPDDFINRELRDTQYIAKKAREILEQMVPTVTATTGSITSRLRNDWQLVNIMQELNWDKYHAQGLTETFKDKDGRTYHRIKDWTKRNDHRHHAMDALTIAFTKPSIIQYLNHLNSREDKTSVTYAIECKELHRSKRNDKLVFNPPMPIELFRAEAKKHLEHILVSIKAKNKVVTRNVNRVKVKGGYKKKVELTPRGSLSNETLYGTAPDGSFTQRVAITYKLKVENVINPNIRRILEQRLAAFGNKPEAAFSNLDKNPIWLNEEKHIAIKKVKVRIAKKCIPLHVKHDHMGKAILDKDRLLIPNDYVQTGSNHHVAIFRDAKGNLQEHIVSFFEATTRAIKRNPVIDRDYNKEKGWEFLFTMKINEYFVLPNPKTGFDPRAIDLKDPENFALISPNLFRVQKLSSKFYNFRHHLDTTVDETKELQGVTWKRIQTLKNLEGIVKVHVNHIGEIVDVGEY